MAVAEREEVRVAADWEEVAMEVGETAVVMVVVMVAVMVAVWAADSVVATVAVVKETAMVAGRTIHRGTSHQAK